MDDRAREPAHDGQPLRLNDFAQVLAVELAQPVADLPQENQGQSRRTRHEFEHLFAPEEINFGGFACHGAGRARLVLDHRHFTENIARFDLRENVARIFAEQTGNLDQAVLYAIQSVTGVAFSKDFVSALEGSFGGNFFEGLQLPGVELTEHFADFKRYHGCTLENF